MPFDSRVTCIRPLVLATGLALATAVHADAPIADASPDTGFGNGGSVTYAVLHNGQPMPLDGISHVVHADDSVTVIAAYSAGGVHLNLRRFKRDGTPDTTFGPDGFVDVDLSTCGTFRTTIVAQPTPDDGFLVSANTCIARLDHQGALVTTYGTEGVVRTPTESQSLLFRADASGRAHAFRRNSTVTAWEVTRYTSDGQRDATFGDNGTGRLVTGTGPNQWWDSFVQTDGKPILIGWSGPMGAAGRWTTGGLPDPDFGTNGMTATPSVNGVIAEPSGVAQLEDGRLVLPSTMFSESIRHLVVLVASPDGRQFSASPAITSPRYAALGSDAAASDMRAVTFDQRRSAIVLNARTVDSGATPDYVVLCLDAANQPDARCGEGGLRHLDTVIDGQRGIEKSRWATFARGNLFISGITRIDPASYVSVWRLGFDRIFTDGTDTP
ncbi:hypothetical protein [Tahibacter amnicola]|uniref:Delta-60 repeat protein n=1 Tax=Tahibacter amnicola TaxID=2976241 RepID=A0ABY6BRQ7_9GAMM|nr:hypothetical protein [Tahibacter amnicola]UXI70452.1 hypothetical protein N4264_12695 [Tahibacter amnicola]